MNAADAASEVAEPPDRAAGANPAPLASGTRSASYRFVEGWHLRQWALRAVLPIAALATNGAGRLDLAALPRFDLPLTRLDLPASAATATLAGGAILVAVSAWVRVLSKGVLVRKRQLTTGGVYRVVRHPFYLANLIGAVGTLVLAGPLGVLVAALWLSVALPIYHYTIAGEEDGLATLYPDGWAKYTSSVPALIPLPGRLGASPATPPRVTWKNLVSEREPPRLLRFLAGALAVAGLGQTSAAGNPLLVLALAVFALSYLVPHLIGGRRG